MAEHIRHCLFQDALGALTTGCQATRQLTGCQATIYCNHLRYSQFRTSLLRHHSSNLAVADLLQSTYVASHHPEIYEVESEAWPTQLYHNRRCLPAASHFISLFLAIQFSHTVRLTLIPVAIDCIAGGAIGCDGD